MGADGIIAAFHGCFDLFFQVCGGFINPDPLVHRQLFKAEQFELRTGGELSNFLGDLNFDDVSRITIVQ